MSLRGTTPRWLALVDDDAATRRALKTLLEEEGWQVEVFASAEEALERLGVRSFDALVTDHILPGIRGAELVRRVVGIHRSMRCVVISGYDPPTDIGFPWIKKPVDLDTLLQVLEGTASCGG